METGVVTMTGSDRMPTFTSFAVVAMVAGLGIRIVGVPELDLHGPLHHLGIMDPLCGGTRAMYLLSRGDFAGAALYNPLVFPLAFAIPVLVLRAAVGRLTGRWVSFQFSPGVRRTLWIVAAVLMVALEVRQQSHATLLMQPWP